MSIYATFLMFDGEEPDEPRPIRYQKNKYPLDPTQRDGGLQLAFIPAHIGNPDWNAPNYAPYKPYLRFSLASKTSPSGIELDGVDVMLDRAQVKTLRDALTYWLDWSEDEV